MYQDTILTMLDGASGNGSNTPLENRMMTSPELLLTITPWEDEGRIDVKHVQTKVCCRSRGRRFHLE